MGVQLLLHEAVQHCLREQRLLVAKSLPDEDQGHDRLTAGIQPQSIEGIQWLLGGLVQGQVQQKATVVFPAALVDELIGIAVVIQAVETLVQRQVGAELRQAGGAVLCYNIFNSLKNLSGACATPQAGGTQ